MIPLSASSHKRGKLLISRVAISDTEAEVYHQVLAPVSVNQGRGGLGEAGRLTLKGGLVTNLVP